MAFETELSNLITQSDTISDAISEAFVQAVVALPFVHMEPLPTGITNVKVFRKNGALISEKLAESATYTYSANSELTQTSSTATAVKSVVNTKLSVEAEEFSSITLDMLTDEQAAALMRELDGDVYALFSGFSGLVTAASTATVQDLLEAQFTVRSSTAGVSQTPYVWIGDYKQMFEVISEVNQSAATNYANESQISLLRGITMTNGFRGTLPGIACYETSGLPTAADITSLVFDPRLAMAGIMSDSVNTRVDWNSDEFNTIISSWVFSDHVEWNDEAGARMESDA